MNDSLFFATFAPLYVNAPDACNLCIAQPPAFNMSIVSSSTTASGTPSRVSVAQHAPPDGCRNSLAGRHRNGRMRRPQSKQMTWTSPT
jgi:hypothetical protein